MTDYIAGLAIAGILIALTGLYLIDRWDARRVKQRQADAPEAAVEAEKQCALVGDPTGIDAIVAELAPTPKRRESTINIPRLGQPDTYCCVLCGRSGVDVPIERLVPHKAIRACLDLTDCRQYRETWIGAKT